MSKENYDSIIENINIILDKNTLSKIKFFKYKEIEEISFIEVYLKETYFNEGFKTKDLGTILTSIEDYAKKNNFNIVVTFFKA